LLQALAMRRPVVASDVGGIPEVIRPGETGWLVPPGDPEALGRAIVEALADRAGAQRMGGQGRKMVEADYSLQHMGERMEELYRSLVAVEA
jgi:starch synthase (maltosyl-transferring)